MLWEVSGIVKNQRHLHILFVHVKHRESRAFVSLKFYQKLCGDIKRILTADYAFVSYFICLERVVRECAGWRFY